MAERFPGGVISKTPPTVVGPTDGEGGSASGVWTLDEVLGYEKAGGWPKPPLPRFLYAWGNNSSGELGLSDQLARSSPVQVGAIQNWSAISAAESVSSAITSDGKLYSWGLDLFGALGQNTNGVSKSSPTQIGALTNWESVSCGYFAAGAIKTDGTLWMWGYNLNGNLGLGDTADRSSPVQVGASTDWAQVSGGFQHTVAVKTNGTLYAWGANGSIGAGRLGDGTTDSRSSPVQIGALTTWVEASASRYHSVGRRSNTEVFSWGSGANGRLGDNTTIAKSSPVLVGSGFSKVSSNSSGSHTLALKTNGTLYAWGYQGPSLGTPLGDGTDIPRSSPVQIGALTNWSQIFAGRYFSSSIKTDGTLWTWGRNNQGQLGDGTVAYKSSPVQVGSLTNWEKSAGGSFHILAVAKG